MLLKFINIINRPTYHQYCYQTFVYKLMSTQLNYTRSRLFLIFFSFPTLSTIRIHIVHLLSRVDLPSLAFKFASNCTSQLNIVFISSIFDVFLYWLYNHCTTTCYEILTFLIFLSVLIENKLCWWIVYLYTVCCLLYLLFLPAL